MCQCLGGLVFTVRDTANFTAPASPAEGILETWVNGKSTYIHGVGATDAREGRLVTRNLSS
jgi:N-acyl-D-amino-acid deacylase